MKRITWSVLFVWTLIFIATVDLQAKIPDVAIKGKAKPITDGALYFMSPRWSPDGKRLAFSESKYTGVWILDLDTGNLKQLTNEVGAGFGFQWSSDSQDILCRVSKYENYRRYNAVKIFNTETGEARLLTDYRSLMTGLPRWTADDTKVYLRSNKGLEFFTANEKKTITRLKKDVSRQKVFYATEKGLVIEDENKSSRTWQPVEGTYLNVELAPDGEKIAFEILGGNMYVLDLNSGRAIDLGPGNHPQWSPDSRKLVYMITEDDGYRFTKSDIYIINIDGTGKTNLTNTTDLLEMNPSWSPDGKKIAFDEMNSGIIYVIEME